MNNFVREQKREFKRQMMDKFEPIFEQDVTKMRSVPKQLCDFSIQNRFIDAKRNIINRRVQTMIECKTRSEWASRKRNL